jgi:alkylhydroperoxidase/carboxymuconolactone decarboxylase family protein YurZ
MTAAASEKQARPGSMVYLAEHHPRIAEAFLHGVREAVDTAGPLDAKTRELVLLGAYTAARHPHAFKVHCRRALENGASAAEVRHAVLMTFGAPVPLEPVVDALMWCDDVIAEVGT